MSPREQGARGGESAVWPVDGRQRAPGRGAPGEAAPRRSARERRDGLGVGRHARRVGAVAGEDPAVAPQAGLRRRRAGGGGRERASSVSVRWCCGRATGRPHRLATEEPASQPKGTHFVKRAALLEHDALDLGGAGRIEALARVAGVVGFEVERARRQLRGVASARRETGDPSGRASERGRDGTRAAGTRSANAKQRPAAGRVAGATHAGGGLLVERRELGVARLAEDAVAPEGRQQVVRHELVTVEQPDDDADEGDAADVEQHGGRRGCRGDAGG